jgi:hypothetical protein
MAFACVALSSGFCRPAPLANAGTHTSSAAAAAAVPARRNARADAMAE